MRLLVSRPLRLLRGSVKKRCLYHRERVARLSCAMAISGVDLVATSILEFVLEGNPVLSARGNDLFSHHQAMFEGSHHQRNLGYWSLPAGRSPHHVTAAASTVPVRSRNPSFLLLAPPPPHPCLRLHLQNSSWRRVRVGHQSGPWFGEEWSICCSISQR